MANAYFLNGKNIKDYGIIPGRSDNSNLAIAGLWDMPARIGKTHHEWPDDNGIEPYLREEEIFFGGRDLTFTFFLRATDRNTAIHACYAMFDDINSFTDLVTFAATDYGVYHVLIKDEVKIEYMAQGWCKGVLTMREPVVQRVDVPDLTADNITPSIDNISIKKLGFEIVSMTGQYNRPGSKSTDVTAYGFEGYKVAKTGFRTFNLELVGAFVNYTAFNSAIRSLTDLLSKPNARTLIHNGVTREFFAKDGFKITLLFKQGNGYVCKVNLPLSEIRVLDNYNLLTDNSGNVLTDAHGVPLALILGSVQPGQSVSLFNSNNELSETGILVDTETYNFS